MLNKTAICLYLLHIWTISFAQITRQSIDLSGLKIKSDIEYVAYDSINNTFYFFFQRSSNGLNNNKVTLVKVDSDKQVVATKEFFK